jgi:predicted outer membrane repeat protein
VIRKNVSNNFGGGIFSHISAIQVYDCVLDSNESSNGGGLCLHGSSGSSIQNCVFKSNYASEGGGAYVAFGQSTLASNRFTTNSAFLGGGMFIQDNNSTVQNCGFDNNQAYRGGGIYCFQAADGNIINCEFFNNTAILQQSQQSAGGAICCLASSPLIRGCTLHLNYADSGGGIYLNNSALPEIENCLITSSRKGRAISCTPSLPILISCTNIFGNVNGDWVGCLLNKQFTNGNKVVEPGYCQTSAPGLTLSSASLCLPQNNSCGVLFGSNGQGCVATDISENQNPLPSNFALSQNYPNPFNPSTIIEYSLPGKSHVNIYVSNILGEVVANLLNQTKSAGKYQLEWDGKDNHGRPVASGIYFYSIKTESFSASRKMILLR